MSENTTPTFISLAQKVVAANDAKLSLPYGVFDSIAEALARIGITSASLRVLTTLSESSRAMATGLNVNNRAAEVITSNNAANNDNLNPGTQPTESLKEAA